MNYLQAKKKNEQELNAFPMGFAFSKEQFVKACEKLGVDPDDAKNELVGIPGGGFIRREDKSDFIDMLKRHRERIENVLKDPEQLIKAFIYELGNHEYCITGDREESFEALGLNPEGLTDEQENCFSIVREKYMANVVCGTPHQHTRL